MLSFKIFSPGFVDLHCCLNSRGGGEEERVDITGSKFLLFSPLWSSYYTQHRCQHLFIGLYAKHIMHTLFYLILKTTLWGRNSYWKWKSFSVTPWTIQSMQFSRPEYWSGWPFPPPGIFLTQGSKPGLLHCGQVLYQLSHQGSPRILEWVTYPFSSRSSWLSNWTGVSCIAGGFFTSWATGETQGQLLAPIL